MAVDASRVHLRIHHASSCSVGINNMRCEMSEGLVAGLLRGTARLQCGSETCRNASEHQKRGDVLICFVET